MLRAVVFDLDGTLYQNDEIGEEVSRAACRYVASIRGVSIDEAARLIEEERARHRDVGSTLSRAVEALGGNLKDLHERLGEEIHPEGVLSVDPRVPTLLKALGQRFDLVIYTNNNPKLSERIMKEIGVTGLFRWIFTIEDFWRPKPDREALETILKRIGRLPAETLFVGDRYDVDLKLPAAMGCAVHETQTVEQLLQLEKL